MANENAGQPSGPIARPDSPLALPGGQLPQQDGTARAAAGGQELAIGRIGKALRLGL